jgi:hypothetical protein
VPVLSPGASFADEKTLTVDRPAVLIATIEARCDGCDWSIHWREAVMLRVELDDRYAQHVPIVREGRAEYKVLVGSVSPGRHSVSVEVDREASARDLRSPDAASVRIIDVHATLEGDKDFKALSLAPFVYERPNASGRFTDVPLFMFYEEEPTPRGTRYRYSVIFSNEDGGTPADRLMATWGRTTDIEYLYSVELDQSGMILQEDIQGPDHEILPFAGTREGRHPLLWVVTDNNMVLPIGTTSVRYAPAPVAVSLKDTSRERVMDDHPWLYGVMARELAREGKVRADAPPGLGAVPDPRRFVYLEACGELNGAALAFSVDIGTPGATSDTAAGAAWIPSDRGVAEYRIARDGCFRAAVPVPPSITARDLRGIRAHAYLRPSKDDVPRPMTGRVRLTRLNKVFMLDERYQPGPSRFDWRGEVTLIPDGPPAELPVK